MTEPEAFLGTIHAHPADDLPRLVYADWLEEHGHQAYAEFIRVSCRIAHETLPPDDRAALRGHRFACFRRMRQAYPAAFGNLPFTVNHFQRGISEYQFTVESGPFAVCSPHWWPVICPRSLTLLEPDERPREVAASPYFNHVTALRLLKRQDVDFADDLRKHPPMAESIMRALALSPHLGRLRALEVRSVRATADGLDAFGWSPLASQLEAFRMSVVLTDWEVATVDVQRPTGGQSVRTAIDQFLAEYGGRLQAAPLALPPARG